MGRAEALSAMTLVTDRAVASPSTTIITRAFIDIVFVIFFLLLSRATPASVLKAASFCLQ
jgi:hypothetical protein